MLFPSPNISTKKSFANPQDLALLTSKDLSLDNYECCWGLSRGQLDAYRQGPGNHLRIQPALKAALNGGRVIILPSDDILRQLLDLQKSNEAGRFQDRRLFFETVPFGTYEYRVIPLKKNVTLYAKDPITQMIAPLDPDAMTISADVHPFFLVAYVAEIIHQHHIKLSEDLHRLLFRIRIHWAILPCFEFVQGSYEGEFGRHLSFRNMKRRHPGPPIPSLTRTASASTASTCSYRSTKRLRSSSPATDEDEDVVIRTWVAKCDPNNFDPIVDNDADIGAYRLEVVTSIKDAINTKENIPLGKSMLAPKQRNPKRKRD